MKTVVVIELFYDNESSSIVESKKYKSVVRETENRLYVSWRDFYLKDNIGIIVGETSIVPNFSKENQVSASYKAFTMKNGEGVVIEEMRITMMMDSIRLKIYTDGYRSEIVKKLNEKHIVKKIN
jgi:hypothetical protein